MVQNGLSVLETYMLVLDLFSDTRMSLSLALQGNGFLVRDRGGGKVSFGSV